MKRVFICFDYDHDRNYRYLLSALKANPRSDLRFDDVTPNEIKSSSIPYIKARLTEHIQAATHTLVVIGSYANTYHADINEIGERNWQWWEIKKSIELSRKLVGVKIDRSYGTPTPLLNASASWALSFSVESMIKAIDTA